MRSRPHEQKRKFLRKPTLELPAGGDFVVRVKPDDSLKGISHRILASISGQAPIRRGVAGAISQFKCLVGHHP
jgi:hypothetical protein